MHHQYLLVLVLNFSTSFFLLLSFPAGALSGDDPHLLQQGDGDHLGQHSPCGGERVHVASKAVCCTRSQQSRVDILNCR